MREQEYTQENSEVYLGLLDSKAEQLPIMLLLLTLPSLQPTLNLPRWDGISSSTLLGVNQG